jgi:hypothetical protein
MMKLNSMLVCLGFLMTSLCASDAVEGRWFVVQDTRNNQEYPFWVEPFQKGDQWVQEIRGREFHVWVQLSEDGTELETVMMKIRKYLSRSTKERPTYREKRSVFVNMFSCATDSECSFAIFPGYFLIAKPIGTEPDDSPVTISTALPETVNEGPTVRPEEEDPNKEMVDQTTAPAMELPSEE